MRPAISLNRSHELLVSMIPEILSYLCYLLAFANITSKLTAKSRSFGQSGFMHWSTFRSLLGTNVLIVMLLGSEALWLVTKVTSMPGAQAKILSDQQLEELLCFADTTRHPGRNRLIVLLSVKAGLRAGEIAKLTWEMLVDPEGDIGNSMELRDCAAKKGSGRRLPIHLVLRQALLFSKGKTGCTGAVIRFRARRPDDRTQHRSLV